MHPRGVIVETSSLIEIIAWCRASNKLSSKPIMTQLSDAYTYHKGSRLPTWIELIPLWRCNHLPSTVWDEITDGEQYYITPNTPKRM